MQFWPRKRAKRSYAKVRCWPAIKEAKAAGFAGYKAGMTHILINDEIIDKVKKTIERAVPVTVIECPPIKIMAARFYQKDGHMMNVVSQVTAKNLDKELKRKITLPKSPKEPAFEDIAFDMARIVVYTQPKATGIGKKKPDIFEMAVGGKKEEQLAFIKENLGKEISIDSVFKEGDQCDIHAVTKGKGFQGPVKRFGIAIRSHKSEKAIRNPGSLGGWSAQGHVMYRVPHAGKMGFHMRTEYNKKVMKISNNPKEINPKGGFVRFGEVKSTFMLVKGSIPGPINRMIILSHSMRPCKAIGTDAPQINYISLDSKQR